MWKQREQQESMKQRAGSLRNTKIDKSSSKLTKIQWVDFQSSKFKSKLGHNNWPWGNSENDKDILSKPVLHLTGKSIRNG